VSQPHEERESPSDEGAPGFFARNRMPRLVTGIAVSAILVAAYVFGILAYRAGLTQEFPQQQPPAGGVSVVIVPESVAPQSQEMTARVLLFPAADLVDAAGLLTREVEVRIQPAISGQALVFPAGEAPAPQEIVLPASGVVQQYPFDGYAVSADVHALSVLADAEDILPTATTVFFRVPGWSDQETTTSTQPGGGSTLSSRLVRDGSTKSIAVLLLLLMVALATIAILVTGSATRGRMKLELSVASWMTALLFALLPIRGFFPGGPPLGSWMDVLVFFWVELILMISVAAVAGTILLRARDARHHQRETP
jgi:hypothetical protein